MGRPSEQVKTVNQRIKEYFGIMLEWLASKKYGQPFCIIETGTMRDTRMDGHEDGMSTFVIADWIRYSQKEHVFYSIDISPYHQQQCNQFLEHQKLDKHVTGFMLGDGTKILEAFGRPIDFAYLDAGASAIETYEQFMRVLQWRCEPTLILIDDTFDVRNASKGILAMPVAEMMGLPIASLMDRMGIIGCGLDLAELTKLLPEEAKFNLYPNLDPKSWEKK